MDERDKSLAEEQAKETAAAAEISAAETEGSEDEIVLPPKRGRGRPPKNPKSDEEEDRRPEVPACPGNDPDNVSDEVPSETDEAEEPTITQSNDYTYAGMFSESHKAEVREKQFPIDLHNAYELGKKVCS